LAILLIGNIVLLIANGYQLRKMTSYGITHEIKKENISDAVIRAASVLQKDGWKNGTDISVSTFEYSYSLKDHFYHIDIGVISTNAVFMEQKYQITENNVWLQADKYLIGTDNDAAQLLSLNQLYTIFADIQEHLYFDWFHDCQDSYAISYQGTILAENIPVDFTSRNYPVYILQNDRLIEVKSEQDVTGENYLCFEVCTDDTIRYLCINTTEPEND
jgi:hypothetical protein